MTTEERKDYIYKAMLEMIQADSDLVVEICDELDSWNGFLGDDRCYNMYDIDDLLYGKKPSEIIDMMTSDFDKSCEWFYFSIYGLESCDDKADFYLDCHSHEEILDEYLNTYYHCSLSNDDFETLAEEYDDYTEEDFENENDEEFTARIDELVS